MNNYSRAFLAMSVIFAGVIFGYHCIQSNKQEQNTAAEPDYNVGTPAYDLMAITNSKTITLGKQQKAVIVGVDVMSLWLENAHDKEIVSVTTFNRGIQGSTSSFFIVYWDAPHWGGKK